MTAVRDGERLACQPATLDDVALVLQLVNACEQHDVGAALLEQGDIIGDWQRPSFDLPTESVCVFDGDRLVAYGEVYKGRRAEVSVHPAARGRGVGTALLRWTWAVSRARGGSLIGQTVSSSSDAVALFRAYGYSPLWTSWVLELPPGAEIDPPALSAAFDVRAYEPGCERVIFQVVEAAFNEWPDRDPSSYEDWAASFLLRPDFEPWNLRVVVEADGAGNEQIVGACIVSVSEDEAWIHQIAVRADRRGLGLGRALLAHAFAVARERGAIRCELNTDSRTGALSLYEHVGMRVKQTFEHYAREI